MEISVARFISTYFSEVYSTNNTITDSYNFAGKRLEVCQKIVLIFENEEINENQII